MRLEAIRTALMVGAAIVCVPRVAGAYCIYPPGMPYQQAQAYLAQCQANEQQQDYYRQSLQLQRQQLNMQQLQQYQYQSRTCTNFGNVVTCN